jgi:hypothetical protein
MFNYFSPVSSVSQMLHTHFLTPFLSEVQLGEDLEPSNKEMFRKTGSFVHKRNITFHVENDNWNLGGVK